VRNSWVSGWNKVYRFGLTDKAESKMALPFLFRGELRDGANSGFRDISL